MQSQAMCDGSLQIQSTITSLCQLSPVGESPQLSTELQSWPKYLPPIVSFQITPERVTGVPGSTGAINAVTVL